jgi:uncharacterized membrane protein (DUF106 family)
MSRWQKQLNESHAKLKRLREEETERVNQRRALEKQLTIRILVIASLVILFFIVAFWH